MAKEIERKFLVTGDGWRDGCDAGTAIRQAYLVVLDDRSVRVRIAGERTAKLTIKLGGAALVRDEFEYDIPLADAAALMDRAVGRVIVKTRYRLAKPPHVWEIDVFEAELAGLHIAEIELQDAAEAFRLPDWVGREVTGDPTLTNQGLATGRRPVEVVR